MTELLKEGEEKLLLFGGTKLLGLLFALPALAAASRGTDECAIMDACRLSHARQAAAHAWRFGHPSLHSCEERARQGSIQLYMSFDPKRSSCATHLLVLLLPIALPAAQSTCPQHCPAQCTNTLPASAQNHIAPQSEQPPCPHQPMDLECNTLIILACVMQPHQQATCFT